MSIHTDVYFEALETVLSETERARLAQLAESSKAQLKATRICAFSTTHTVDTQVHLKRTREQVLSDYLEAIGIPAGLWDVFFVESEQQLVTQGKTGNSWIDVGFSECLHGERLQRERTPGSFKPR